MALANLKMVWFCASDPLGCGCLVHYLVQDDEPPNAIFRAIPGQYRWSGVVIDYVGWDWQ
jgi:hypothetical protein